MTASLTLTFAATATNRNLLISVNFRQDDKNKLFPAGILEFVLFIQPEFLTGIHIYYTYHMCYY